MNSQNFGKRMWYIWVTHLASTQDDVHDLFVGLALVRQLSKSGHLPEDNSIRPIGGQRRRNVWRHPMKFSKQLCEFNLSIDQNPGKVMP